MSSTSHAGLLWRGLAVAATLTLGTVAAGPAQADSYAGETVPKVAPVDLRGRALSPSQAGPKASGASPARSAGSQSTGLAVTGADMLPLTILGLGAAGAGSILVLTGRRRRASS